ncbi:hypothetical protein BGW41_006674 [Actinomortierella wolfii]|nr:hypothetical protein BGW41_006674 [Actinomortierella wolfii]
MKIVEDVLFCWFLKRREAGLNVDDSSLRAQAVAIWTELMPRFKPETDQGLQIQLGVVLEF